MKMTILFGGFILIHLDHSSNSITADTIILTIMLFLEEDIAQARCPLCKSWLGSTGKTNENKAYNFLPYQSKSI